MFFASTAVSKRTFAALALLGIGQPFHFPTECCMPNRLVQIESPDSQPNVQPENSTRPTARVALAGSIGPAVRLTFYAAKLSIVDRSHSGDSLQTLKEYVWTGGIEIRSLDKECCEY